MRDGMEFSMHKVQVRPVFRRKKEMDCWEDLLKYLLPLRIRNGRTIDTDGSFLLELLDLKLSPEIRRLLYLNIIKPKNLETVLCQ